MSFSFFHFIESSHKYELHERLLQYKIRVLSLISAGVSVLLFLFGIYRISTGQSIIATVDIIFALLLASTMLIVRRNKNNYDFASLFFLFIGLLTLLFNFFLAYDTSTRVLWFASFMVVIFFLRDKVEGLALLSIYLLFLIYEYLFDYGRFNGYEYIIFGANLIFMATILYWYEKIKERDREYLVKMNSALEESVEKRTYDLRIAKKEAEKANQSKSIFLANMSHEIRTPLNAVIGFIDMLKGSEDDKEKLKYIETMSNSSHALVEIVDSILDLSKIENGKLDINRSPFNVKDEFDTIFTLFKARCIEKDINYTQTMDKSLPTILVSDVLRLKQITTNLLSNAVKFTNSGGNIETNIDYVKGELQVSIKDDGIGIKESKLGVIFKEFSQAELATSHEYGGTGLGLSISSHLVDILGGTLNVESEFGKGSKFFFRIPTRTGTLDNSVLQEKKKEVIYSGGHMLLAEDNPANQMLMGLMLKKFGYSYELAKDGVEAVEKFKNGKYDAVLMDENMPYMMGTEATKKIREYERIKNFKPTYIIALTASAIKGDKERFLASGMDAYLPKPFKIGQLQSVLLQNTLDITQRDSSYFDELKTSIDKVQEMGFHEDEVGSLVNLFFENSERLMKNMKKAVLKDDLDVLMKSAHELKGSSANMNFNKINMLADKISMGAESRANADYADLVEEIADYLQGYKNAYKGY